MSALGALGGKRLSQVERVPYENAFLIAELLTNKITVLAGEPKAGKTLLAAGMVIALLDGEEAFLDQRVHRRLEHVAFGLTDDDAEAELLERFVGTGVEDRVTVFPVHGIQSTEEWAHLRHALIDDKVDLFVLDNMLGALSDGADISDSPTTQAFMRGVKKISDHIPVLLVTHVAKGALEGTSVASAPIGGRYIASSARGIVALRKSANEGRRVEAVTNRGRGELKLSVEVAPRGPGADVPVWTIREAPPKAGKKKRSDEKLEKAGRAAQAILADQPAKCSMRRLGSLYGADVGLSEEQLRKLLSGLITHDGSQWVSKGEAA